MKQFYDGVTGSCLKLFKEPYPMPFFEGDVGGPTLNRNGTLTLIANNDAYSAVGAGASKTKRAQKGLRLPTHHIILD